MLVVLEVGAATCSIKEAWVHLDVITTCMAKWRLRCARNAAARYAKELTENRCGISVQLGTMGLP